jgi:hypothetical protein
MRIFKYGKKQHLMGLLGMGTLRIGTLSDYRKGEHAKGISDASEGTKDIVNKIEKLNISGKDWGDQEKKSAEMLLKFGMHVEPGANVTMLNSTFVKKFEIDAFIFCFSIEENPSLKTMRQFEGADSCLEIIEPDGFFNELQATIAQVSGAHRVIPAQAVEYKERNEIYNGKDFGLHPGLIKELSFRPQNEGRIIWEYGPENRGYEPFIAGHWRLGSYCKEVSF